MVCRVGQIDVLRAFPIHRHCREMPRSRIEEGFVRYFNSSLPAFFFFLSYVFLLQFLFNTSGKYPKSSLFTFINHWIKPEEINQRNKSDAFAEYWYLVFKQNINAGRFTFLQISGKGGGRPVQYFTISGGTFFGVWCRLFFAAVRCLVIFHCFNLRY